MIFFTGYRRKKLRSRPFPRAWEEILERNVPLWQRLSLQDREELKGHVQVFLAEKNFEGAGGVFISDDMRVTVAAQACLLLLHRDSDYFPRVSSIIIYPDEYAAPHWEMDEAGIVTEGIDWRSGETWGGGSVVFAWKDVMWGAEHPHDGYNVVLHEFAHELDVEDGITDGTPPLRGRGEYLLWRKTLQREFDQLRENAAQRRHPTLLDPYGAEHPAEFFAVAVETFFELPAELHDQHPDLYEVLKGYFRQDPARWAKG